MSRAASLAIAAALLFAGCAKQPLPPPASVHTVAVFPPNNRTGDELLITGGTILEKYVFHTERLTVPDVLAAEARTVLEGAGYTLVAPELIDAAIAGHAPTSAAQAAALAAAHGLPGDVLYIDLRQWAPELTYGPDGVIVSMRMELVEGTTGRLLWSADHPARPVQTPATINFAHSYWVAARSVVRQMLEPFGAKRAAQ